MTRRTQAWSCGSFARARVPWCCWMEPNSVEAWARMIASSCCAASGSRPLGAVAFGWPARSPTSIVPETFWAILAQRQKGWSFGK